MAFSLQDYEIIAEIGQGGFASVFRAKQKSLQREVALKRLSPQRMQNASEILRFKREADAMAALTHDNIVAVFDYAFHGGSYYIVMEYIDGLTFETALERGVPQECGLFVAEKAAAALRTAHEQNIIHRDIKPANILLGRNGQVKVADFGLALFHTGIESLTSPGTVLGTISYMAPEALVSPKEVDNRVDVFSLGCIVYQVLAGKHPFAGADFGEISNHLLNDDPPPLPAAAPAKLAEMTMRCLQKDREKRPSMPELQEALTATLRAMYHEAQEKLTAFVRRDRRHQPTITVPAAEAGPAPGKKRTTVIVAASLLAAVTVTTVVFLAHSPFTTKKPQTTSLPALPSFRSSFGSSEASHETPPQGTRENKIKDGPEPITASALDMKVGTVVIKGLAPQDTIVLNGKPVPASKTAGEEARLEMAPGHYHLDILRKNGAPVGREFELVPFERQTIDLRKEP